MPPFRYLALDPAGKLARGLMDASDEAEVIARLQAQGHTPMRAEPAGGALHRLMTWDVRGSALRAQEVADLTRELSIMLAAGMDLDRALRFLVEAASRPRLRAVLNGLRDAVRDGDALASAMARYPGSFSPLYLGMVRAGEAGGTLALTLERLAVLLERQRALSATLVSAMIYPALLMAAAGGSVALLLTEVLPQFVPLFAQNGAALPASTQMLLEIGNLVSSYGLYAVVVVLLLLVAAQRALQRPGPRLIVDRMLLQLPMVGTLLRETMASRFTRTLGTLLLNGVPLIAALGIVRGALGNRAGMEAVDRAATSARSGAGLANPLRDSGYFPLRTTHLLRLGEETAQLGAMALRAAEIHEETARIGVQRLVALLVPAITIIMGAVVAAIVSSLLLAMLSLNDLAN